MMFRPIPVVMFQIISNKITTNRGISVIQLTVYKEGLCRYLIK